MSTLRDGKSKISTINRKGDKDWFVVEIENTGTANFYLDPKDDDLDVNLYIYEGEDGDELVAKSRNKRGKHELIAIDVRKGDIYSIKVQQYGRFNGEAEYEIKVKSYEKDEDEEIIENDDYDFETSNPGREVTPRYINKKGHRSAKNYRKIVEQFDVEDSNRYKAHGSSTYCNIFMWDVSIAMDAEIPHRVHGKEQRANDIYDNLTENLSNREIREINGDNYDSKSLRDCPKASYGYRLVTARDAQAYANEGKPVIASWKSSSESGHLAVIVPQKNESKIKSLSDLKYDMKMAQAGHNPDYQCDYKSLIYAFGEDKINDVLFFMHE